VLFRSVAALLPHAYKAVRIATEADVASADAMPGDYVLVDAKVEGLLGGTGQRVDPALVTGLAKRRRVVLAGGLTPENVAQAVAVVGPYCVDVASGVERSPGVKDLARVEAFLAAVRGARGVTAT
jgi:phosphoribosylanthranilate isomerase